MAVLWKKNPHKQKQNKKTPKYILPSSNAYNKDSYSAYLYGTAIGHIPKYSLEELGPK